MIKAAIVGLGWWGQHIVSTLQNKSEKLEFVRAVDIDPKEKNNFAKENGLLLSTVFEEILNDPRVNSREVGEREGIEYFQYMEKVKIKIGYIHL